jgi:hypothetical protein
MPVHPPYTRHDIIAWLGAREVMKGEPYVRRVRDLQWRGQHLRAQVQGTAPRPYVVDIAFIARNHGRMSISAECSCPVAYECKHAAAVLLAALQAAPDTAQTSVNPAVIQWLAAFHASQAAVQTPLVKASAAPAQLFYLLQIGDRGDCTLRFCKGKRDASGRLKQPLDYWSNVEGAFRARAVTIWPRWTTCWQAAGCIWKTTNRAWSGR